MFKCRISNIKFFREDDVKTDVYLYCDFDHWLTFSTPTVKNVKDAEFKDFARLFVYETKYSNHLECKKFRMTLYRPMFLYSTLIGSCEIDLHTLATGPKKYRLSCYSTEDNEEKVGTLEFSFYFRSYSDVQIHFSNVKFNLNYDVQSHKEYFFYYCGTNTKDFETTEFEDNFKNIEKILLHQKEKPKLFWENMKPLTTSLDWIDLTNEIITLRLDSGIIDSPESEAEGVAYLYLINIIKGAKENEGDFELPLFKDKFEHIGMVTGHVKLTNEPIYCQMKKGVYEDGKIDFNQHFWKGFPQPKFTE